MFALYLIFSNSPKCQNQLPVFNFADIHLVSKATLKPNFEILVIKDESCPHLRLGVDEKVTKMPVFQAIYG
jgi:hypothetical protein